MPRINFKKSRCFQCFTRLQPLPLFASICLSLSAQFAWYHMLLPCQRLAGSVMCVSSGLFYLPRFKSSQQQQRNLLCFSSHSFHCCHSRKIETTYEIIREFLVFSNKKEFKNCGEFYSSLYGVIYYLNAFQEC